MAHENVILTVPIVNCIPLYDLIPGRQYRLTGLSQGSLGNFEVLAIANTTSRFADSVLVFPALSAPTESGWRGTLSSTCQLIHLQDHKNNRVSGQFNISNFPWFPTVSANVADNTILFPSSVNIGGNNFAGIFIGNTITNNSSISVTGAAIVSPLLTIANNFLTGNPNIFVDEHSNNGGVGSLHNLSGRGLTTQSSLI